MVVPEGWEIVELGDKADIYRGSSPRPIDSFLTTKASGINWIKIGDASPYSKYIISSKERIIPEGLLYSRAVFKGDFILSNSMSFGRPYILKINGCIHDGWLAIQNYHRHFDTDFLYYSLCSETVLQQYINMAAGSSVKNLNKEKVAKLIICAPPLPEQLCIAEVLSDTDLYITTLERLIAKKEAVKQGVMQELLTGKRRLPGFKDEWVEKTIEQLVERFATGLNPRQNFTLNTGGINYYVTIKNFFNGVLYLDEECDKIDDSALALINTRSDLQKGDILFSSIGRIGDSYLIQETPKNWNINESVFTLRPNKSIIISAFLYYLLRSTGFQQSLSINSTGSTLTSIKMGHLKPVTLSIPPTLAEQTAIAEILSDMDAELSALKKKLEKIRLIKQGMMDALLTGKIRLPEDKPNVQFTQRKEQEEILYAAEKTEEYTAESKKAKHHANSEGYQDAVILAALVHRFGTKNFPFTAFDCQKFPYLFYRYMEGQTKGYRKFAAGPYNPALKYKTARPIALKKKYIQDHIGKYRGFISGINVQEALNYFQQWYGNKPLAWFEQFRYIPKRKDELELLTTTDMSMVEIRGEGRNITVQSVKELMKKNPEWKDKLNRPIFSDNNIERAIKWSYDLFGGEHD